MAGLLEYCQTKVCTKIVVVVVAEGVIGAGIGALVGRVLSDPNVSILNSSMPLQQSSHTLQCSLI